MTEKKFKLIGDGIILEFYKSCDGDGKLKKKLFSWYNEVFENTRCEFNKELGMLKVYYKDSKAELQGVLRHFASDSGIELHIYNSGSLTTVSEKFIGSDYLCSFDGLTKFIYKDFFETEIKSMIQSATESAQIQSIVNYGKLNTKSLIDSILTEWQDPVKTGLPIVGGAVK